MGLFGEPWANTEGQALNDGPKSSSLDNLLLLLAVLFFAASCVTLVGIIPVLIIVVGAVQAFKSGDVKNMKVSARFVQILVVSGALICVVVAMCNASPYNDPSMIMVFAIVMGLIAYITIQFLWIDPFTRQLPVWQAARAVKKANAKTEEKRIIGRDSLTPYSVADELLKWSKLREDGLITEDEYQEARMKLLGR